MLFSPCVSKSNTPAATALDPFSDIADSQLNAAVIPAVEDEPMPLLANDAPTPAEWPPPSTERPRTPDKVPDTVGILWCANCGQERQNAGGVRMAMHKVQSLFGASLKKKVRI